MPRALANRLTIEHGKEMLALEREELRRLREIYEQARLELLGRLGQYRTEQFTTQQLRVAIAQVEQAMGAMARRLKEEGWQRIERAAHRRAGQMLESIRVWEPKFKGGATGRIQSRALQRLAAPGNLVMHQYRASIDAYGSQLVATMGRRMAVSAAKRSSWRDMSIDLAGRLKTSAVTGSRWKAERIVRTELSNALTAGEQAGLDAASMELPGLYRQWDATLDGRTSDVCATLDGQIRALDEPFVYLGDEYMRPPALPNCRSGLVAWREEWLSNPNAIDYTGPTKPPRSSKIRTTQRDKRVGTFRKIGAEPAPPPEPKKPVPKGPGRRRRRRRPGPGASRPSMRL